MKMLFVKLLIKWLIFVIIVVLRMAMGRALVLLAALFAVGDAAVVMYDKPDVAFLACKAELQFGNPAFTCVSFAEDISTKQQAHNIPKSTLKDVVRHAAMGVWRVAATACVCQG